MSTIERMYEELEDLERQLNWARKHNHKDVPHLQNTIYRKEDQIDMYELYNKPKFSDSCISY
jgi:hypothetical protein